MKMYELIIQNYYYFILNFDKIINFIKINYSFNFTNSIMIATNNLINFIIAINIKK